MRRLRRMLVVLALTGCDASEAPPEEVVDSKPEPTHLLRPDEPFIVHGDIDVVEPLGVATSS